MGLGTNASSYIPRLRVGVTNDEKGRKKSIIGMKCDADTPGAQEVYKKDGTAATDKDGRQVYRLEFDFIEGLITGMERVDRDFGQFLEVTIEDGSDKWILQLTRGSRYWTDLCLRLPMVNLNRNVRLSPYSIENADGKYNQGIAIRQDGEKVDRKWSQANGYEGGPPQAEYDEDEAKWMFGKRNRWIDENVVDPAIEKVQKLYSVSAPVAKVAASADDDLPNEEEESDDLPF